MGKIEELKKLHQQATQGPWWQDDDGFVAAGSGDEYMTVADVRCAFAPQSDVNTEYVILSHNLMPTLLEAAELVRQARSLIAEAVNLHIYNEDNGDVPDPDCPYMAFLKAAKALQEKLK